MSWLRIRFTSDRFQQEGVEPRMPERSSCRRPQTCPHQPVVDDTVGVKGNRRLRGSLEWRARTHESHCMPGLRGFELEEDDFRPPFK
jgi:hypothetical protein